MKTPFHENFALIAGEAVWKNQAENEKRADAKGKFYVDLNGGPESGAILARALLNAESGGHLPVLPGGDATIRKLKTVPVEADGQKRTVRLFAIDGLSYTPSYVWLDEDRQLSANTLSRYFGKGSKALFLRCASRSALFRSRERPI